MPPSRLLQGGSRRQRTSNGASEPSDNAAVLPPYEPPAQVLDDDGKRALREFANTRETHKYQHHLGHATDNLRVAVGAINEYLFNQRAELNRLREKNTGGELSEAQRQLEARIPELEATVAELTNQSEAALREVIDFRAELEDEKQVIARVQEVSAAQTPRVERPPKAKKDRRRRSRRDAAGSDDEADPDADDAEDDEMPDADEEEPEEQPLQGLPEMLQAQREVLAQEYSALSVPNRYAKHNDYIAFKKSWHSALHPDDEVPLADASTWFDAQGQPTWQAGAQMDEDDDLVVERVVIDFKCPLSMQLMMEPYSNHKCKHTFEKSAIIEFLQATRGVGKCPVCSQELRTTDLYLDEAFLRKVKRHIEEQRRAAEEDEEEVSDSDVGNTSVVAKRTRNIKRERMSAMELDDYD